tara:strand:+ start:740 stop:3277 length:2538 start_codon:yes stop_codon:yes gene_type:complete
MNIVVVESPAKAKTINEYLGSDFKVIASYGHVRDLPSKTGSVNPDNNFSMIWEAAIQSKKHMADIAESLKNSNHLYLATDPDREGEAISWHIVEILKDRKLLDKVQIHRVVFHEITKKAIKDAIAHPKELNKDLIEAYLARRALDYLFGFTLSPILWRKVPGSKSAGRVQSVALRLICERESEIELFKPREYWSIDAIFKTESEKDLNAHLTRFDGKKLEKFSLSSKKDVESVAEKLSVLSYKVEKIDRRTEIRRSKPPFTTSTLQQESSRKLGLSAKRTMQVAQKLYEGINISGSVQGLITYMRTDNVNLSDQAANDVRNQIKDQFGDSYLPREKNIYKSKLKNAQEAHEAIRPTNVKLTPQDLKSNLDSEQSALYELIWKRTIASQMENAKLERINTSISSEDKENTFTATGSIVLFDGFLKLYKEGKDENTGGDEERDEIFLPELKENELLKLNKADQNQHFTQPPPRYTEASLVKKLEELGIGRPSTYASIIGVLQARQYVNFEKKHFIPEDRGRIVTSFLVNFFKQYVEYDFTAKMEDRLDGISNSKENWKDVLNSFWSDFCKNVDNTKDLPVRKVIDTLDAELGEHFLPKKSDGGDPRKCPSCKDGRLGIKLSKTGGFIGCSNYEDNKKGCNFTTPLEHFGSSGNGNLKKYPIELGKEPETNKDVKIKKGPYGLYVELSTESDSEKPKRMSIPKNLNAEEINLKKALELLSLPRLVGQHPETKKDIHASIGPFGPYIKHNDAYKSLKEDDVLTIGLNRAVELIAQIKNRGSGASRALGEHPKNKKKIFIKNGRYGPYIKFGSMNVSIPKGMDEKNITIDEAVSLIKKKGATPKKRKESK